MPGAAKTIVPVWSAKLRRILQTAPMIPAFLSSLMLRLACFVLCTTTALAWGPHTEIAQAALDAMGPGDPLAKHLGADTKCLAQYVWMADWRQQLLVRADEVFYSDDVLIFPAAAKHFQHICPEVRQTYAPYFRRALQALRTESPRNAARWIGSLIHFTTDTGSPPHALGILGPTHSKMENWLDAKLIHIPGYKPQLLGMDDAAAEAGFIRRMEGLIEFSKQRAERCRADVDGDRRALVEPVVLESALETTRVTADLLHTLGVLAARSIGDASLSGQIIAPKTNHPTLSRLPVKIVLAGTTFSTLSEAGGSFAFHHLPAVEFRPVISTPGRVMELPPVKLAAGAAMRLDSLDISKDTAGNLIRNPAFQLRWVSAEGFDHWNRRKPPARLAGASPQIDWEGEWIPLVKGITYQLSAQWQDAAASGEDVQIFIRTKARPVYESPPGESAALTPGSPELRITGTAEVAWAQVIVRTRKSPETVIETIRFHSVP